MAGTLRSQISPAGFVEKALMKSVANELLQKKLAGFFGDSVWSREVERTFKVADVDGNGLVDRREIFVMISGLLQGVITPMRDRGIKLQPPSEDKVLEIFADCDLDHNNGLDRIEYELFCEKLIRYLAHQWAADLGKKYGLGIFVSTVGVWAAKKWVRSAVPILGGLSMALVPPALLVGPLVGIAGTWVLDNGGLAGVKRLPAFRKNPYN